MMSEYDLTHSGQPSNSRVYKRPAPGPPPTCTRQGTRATLAPAWHISCPHAQPLTWALVHNPRECSPTPTCCGTWQSRRVITDTSSTNTKFMTGGGESKQCTLYTNIFNIIYSIALTLLNMYVFLREILINI